LYILYTNFSLLCNFCIDIRDNVLFVKEVMIMAEGEGAETNVGMGEPQIRHNTFEGGQKVQVTRFRGGREEKLTQKEAGKRATKAMEKEVDEELRKKGVLV
jgi:hypothetical protein